MADAEKKEGLAPKLGLGLGLGGGKSVVAEADPSKPAVKKSNRGGRPTAASRMKRAHKDVEVKRDRLAKLEEEKKKIEEEMREQQRLVGEERDVQFRKLLEPLVKGFGKRFRGDVEDIAKALQMVEMKMGNEVMVQELLDTLVERREV